MNIFEEVQHRLSSKVRMRGLFKDLHFEDLERIIDRMQALLEEKREAHEMEQTRRKAKAADIKHVHALMEERGLSLEDLGLVAESAAPKTKKRRNLNRYTFVYETLSGDTAYWEGATTGRLPSEFQEYLNRTGKKRLDCVKEEASQEEASLLVS